MVAYQPVAHRTLRDQIDASILALQNQASGLIGPRPFGEITMNLRRIFTAAALIACVLAPSASSAQVVRVGSKNFTEQFVLAEIYAQALEAAGINVEKKLNLGGTLIAHKALEEKQIDMYPEYTGTILLAVLKQESMNDQKAVYDKM